MSSKQYLNRCDDIYVMRNGRIVEHGTHDDLMHYDREYAFLVKSMAVKAEGNADNSHTDSTESRNEDDNSEISNINVMNTKFTSHINNDERKDESKVLNDGSLIVKDTIQRGGIKGLTYYTYMKAAGGYFVLFAAIVAFILNVGSSAFSTWWLALWIKAGSGNTTIERNNKIVVSDNINDNPNFYYYYSIYAGCIGIILFTSLLRGLAITYTTIKASTKLHNDVLKKVMASPITFFETTLSGRLLNVFSADMDEIDNKLPISLESIMQNILIFSFSILFVCTVFVWYLIPAVLLGSLFFYIGLIFRTGIRDLKRWESSLRSPIFSFVSTTTQGLSTIHAFNKEHEFIKNHLCF